MKDELDSAWAVRPMALSGELEQTTLVLEDPGGETLDQLLSGPLEVTQFLQSPSVSQRHSAGYTKGS